MYLWPFSLSPNVCRPKRSLVPRDDRGERRRQGNRQWKNIKQAIAVKQNVSVAVFPYHPTCARLTDPSFLGKTGWKISYRPSYKKIAVLLLLQLFVYSFLSGAPYSPVLGKAYTNREPFACTSWSALIKLVPRFATITFNTCVSSLKSFTTLYP